MSKESILGKVKELETEIHNTVHPDPTDPESRIGSVDNSLEVQYLGDVQSPENRAKIHNAIQAAHTSKPDWEKILGLLAGVLGKMAICLLVVPILIGCSQNPPAIRDAHQIELSAWQAYHENVDRQREAVLADLRTAFEVQVQLLEKYKLARLTIENPKVTEDQVEEVLKEVRQKRFEAEENLTKVKARWAEVDRNYDIGLSIHMDISAYLERESDTSQSELNDAIIEASNRLHGTPSPER